MITRILRSFFLLLILSLSFCFKVIATSSDDLSRRHPDAGIWMAYQDDNTIQDIQKPYIKGVMIYSSWKSIYTGENTFNWDNLDRDLNEIINQAGKKAFIVVAVGYCPNLEWPQFMRNQIASHKEFNNQGCKPLQFWDPEYIRLYKNYIKALADHLADFDSSDSNPNQSDILYLRAQAMADTMENLPNDPEGWKWTDFDPAPNGQIYRVDLTKSISYEYQKTIVLTYKNELNRAYQAKSMIPPTPIAKAGDYWSPLPNRDFFLEEGGIWFDKHSASPNPLGWYYDMVQKVKTGETRGCSESAGSWQSTNLNQFTYWEILTNLHTGVEFIGIFGGGYPELQPKGAISDIKNKSSFEFADKYAGHYRNPSKSPGAWIALRGQYPENRWSGKMHQDRLWTNYEFLMQQHKPQDSILLFGIKNLSTSNSRQTVPIVARNDQQPWNDEISLCLENYPDHECDYLYQKPDKYLGINQDNYDKHEYTYNISDLGKVLYCQDKIFCQNLSTVTKEETMFWARQTDKQNNYNYMRFNINDTFAQSLNGYIKIRVIYLDQGSGQWRLFYDAKNNPDKQALTVTKTDTNLWKEIEIDITDAYFNNRQEENTDISLYNMADDDDIFHMIEIIRENSSYPTITSSSTPTSPPLSCTPPRHFGNALRANGACDNDINMSDYATWFREFFNNETTLYADFNQDNVVNRDDLPQWINKCYETGYGCAL